MIQTPYIWVPKRPPILLPGMPAYEETRRAMPLGTMSARRAVHPPSGPPSVGATLIGEWRSDKNVYSDAGVTLATNNSTVQQWNDQTANANNLTQATAGSRPTYLTAGGPNGKPRIQSASKRILVAFSAITTYEVFLVMQQENWTSGQEFLTNITGSTTLSFAYAGLQRTTTPQIATRGPSLVGGDETSQLALNTWGIVHMRWDSSGTQTYTIAINNLSTVDSGNFGGTGATGMLLGGGSSTFDFAHALFYSTPGNAYMSGSDATKVLNYLNAIYSVF